MLIEYTQAAMRKAHYELLPDDKLYYEEIPEFDGVNATTESMNNVVKNCILFWKTG